MSDLIVPVAPQHLKAITESEEMTTELLSSATQFRSFLRHWRFVDGESGLVRELGDVLWDGQEDFVRATQDNDFIYALKARKLGYCLAPSTRVLTSDLRWVRIGELELGTEIVSVDEHGRDGLGRKMRKAVVEGKRFCGADAVRITLASGHEVVATWQHPFLTGNTSVNKRCLMAWRQVHELRVGDSVRYVCRPWSQGGFEDGWFGGMMDGEAAVQHHGFTIYQNRGPLYEVMKDYLESRGYHPTEHTPRQNRGAIGISRTDEMFRIVGQTRPKRFLGNSVWWEGRGLPGARGTGVGWDRIVKIEPVGERRMVDLQTSTGTFIAEGFVSHNTTLATAYDAWVIRFRDINGRAHLFSRREAAAKDLLKGVKFGLERLPDWMQLPMKGTTSELEMYAGPDDTRRAVAYPADEDTAVEATASHGHVDEWARMGNPERVWQAIEPSMAGTCHIITTGMGPENYTAKFWRLSLSGDTRFKAFFTNALSREGRDEEWLVAKRKGMTETQFRQEYAMRWEDALFGGGKFTFARENLDLCCNGTGTESAELGHRYSIGWDIGRHADAAVGIIVDLSTSPHQVVKYTRLRNTPYPVIQRRIEQDWFEYGGPKCRLLVEKNGPGEAVLENLELPEKVVAESGFVTTKPSKSKIISNLEIAFENGLLRYNAREWPQLDNELRGYQEPDKDVIQDSVMSLAIAYSESYGAARRGRAKIITW